METALTPSPQDVVTKPQARKLAEHLVRGIMKSGIPRRRFQVLLKQEKRLKLTSRLTQLVRTVLVEAIEYTNIRCNYDEDNAFDKAVKEAGFDNISSSLPNASVPPGGKGEINHQVGEMHLGECLAAGQHFSIKETIDRVQGCDHLFVTPLAAIRYVIQLPDRQRQYPLGTLFEADRQLWYLILGEYKGKRRLTISDCYSLEASLSDNLRFLVVPISSSFGSF